MIGDIVEVKPHHLPPARKVIELVIDTIKKAEGLFVLSVGGESGSGKSTLSLAIKKVLEKKGYNTFIFHIDDYFKLPPKDNHDRRVADISSVGPQEVNLELLQEHIDQVKDGTDLLKKPLVHYRENQIREVIVEFDDVDVVIAEGTYSTLLDHIDCKIFMLRNYLDTYKNRAKRGRDPMVPFTEKVLEIEHEILRNHSKMADILVDKNYNVQPQSLSKENSD
jgi:uridine kinase